MADTTNEIKTILIPEKKEITLDDLRKEGRGITNEDRLTVKKDVINGGISITRSGLRINGEMIPFEMGDDPLVRPDAPFNGNATGLGSNKRMGDDLIKIKMDAEKRATPFNFYPEVDEISFHPIVGYGALLVNPANLEPTNRTAYGVDTPVHESKLVIEDPEGRAEMVSTNRQEQIVHDNFRVNLTSSCFVDVKADGEGGVKISFDHSLEELPDEKKELALVPDWFAGDFKLSGKKDPKTGMYVSQIGTSEDRIYSTQHKGMDAIARYRQNGNFKETLVVTPRVAVLKIVNRGQEDIPHEYIVQRLPENSNEKVKVIVDGREMDIPRGQEVLDDINRRINEVKADIIKVERKKANRPPQTD